MSRVTYHFIIQTPDLIMAIEIFECGKRKKPKSNNSMHNFLKTNYKDLQISPNSSSELSGQWERLYTCSQCMREKHATPHPAWDQPQGSSGRMEI